MASGTPSLLSESARRWLGSAEGVPPRQLPAHAEMAAKTGLMNFNDALMIKQMADQISASAKAQAPSPTNVMEEKIQQIAGRMAPPQGQPPMQGQQPQAPQDPRMQGGLGTLPNMGMSFAGGGIVSFATAGSVSGGIPNVPTPEQIQAMKNSPLFRRLLPFVVKQESGGDDNAVSPKGARGRMQVMPETNRDPGFGVTGAQDDSSTERNRVGQDYLAAMLVKYNGNIERALAAYNAGPGAEEEFTAGKRQMPAETKNYSTGIANAYRGVQDFPSVKEMTSGAFPQLTNGGNAPSRFEGMTHSKTREVTGDTVRAVPSTPPKNRISTEYTGPGKNLFPAAPSYTNVTPPKEPSLPAMESREEYMAAHPSAAANAYSALIEKQMAEDEKDKGYDRNMAWANAGFKMAEAGSHGTFGQALAAGGQEAIRGLTEAKRSAGKAQREMERIKAQMAVADEDKKASLYDKYNDRKATYDRDVATIKYHNAALDNTNVIGLGGIQARALQTRVNLAKEQREALKALYETPEWQKSVKQINIGGRLTPNWQAYQQRLKNEALQGLTGIETDTADLYNYPAYSGADLTE